MRMDIRAKATKRRSDEGAPPQATEGRRMQRHEGTEARRHEAGNENPMVGQTFLSAAGGHSCPPASVRLRTLLTCALAILLFVTAASLRAADTAAFVYDPAKTDSYLAEPAGTSVAAAAELKAEVSAAVDEILDGPWAPLYTDYSAAQAGGVGPPEWAFTRPGDKVLALAQAAPFMTPAQKAKAKGQFIADLAAASPTRKLSVDPQGKPRNFRKAPPVRLPTPRTEDSYRDLFPEAYAIWAFASAFDAWKQVRPCFDDLKAMRVEMERRGEFAPAYAPGQETILTAQAAADPQYRSRIYESLFSGYQDNYGYHGAADAQGRMQKGKPVFFYIRQLAGLIGHYRLAKHFGDEADATWARQTFETVAAMTLSQKSSPFLWSDPYLTPEVTRLLRDHAGAFLDALAKSRSVGGLPGRGLGQPRGGGPQRLPRHESPYVVSALGRARRRHSPADCDGSVSGQRLAPEGAS